VASRRARALNIEPQAIAIPAPSPVRLASDEAATPSPARALQAELAASWREEDRLTPIPGRWSGRKSLVVIVGSSALLWAAIIGGASYLLNT
jgi:hypothetical protein